MPRCWRPSRPSLSSSLQIEVELRRRDLKVPEIACVAAQHDDQWRLLGGGLAAPYACRIGERTLRIDAERTYFDGNGRRLGQLGQAPENVLFNRAKSFRERQLSLDLESLSREEDSMSVRVRPLEARDKPVWLALFKGYIEFYKATVAEDVIETPGSG